MKIELLRNCEHGSEIMTYLATDEFGGKKIIKTSTTPSGIKNLRNEVEGWRWYKSLRHHSNESICRIVQQRDSYLQIQIDYINGNKPDYQNGLVRNANAIRSIVEHYCDIWPFSSGSSPMHGDLSLDNIIINSDGVHIIDWEHYMLDAVPWGFDIIYLLLESLYFGMRHRNKPNPTGTEIQIICDHIKTINEHHQLHPDMLKTPLRFIKGFVLTNHHLWGEQLTSFQMKLPIIAFSSDQITMIDDMISSQMA
jgi:hypothetical protein